MRERQPMTETINVSEVRQHLGQFLNKVFRRETRVLVEKSGIPVAAIVSTDDLKRLDQFDRERAERFTVLDEFAAGFSDQSPEEIERETANALAEVRDEMRAERRETSARAS